MMISKYYDGSCQIFLCYRGNEGAEIAKEFKKSLAEIKNKNFGYVWFSDQESIGNYKEDIPVLISSATYAIIFITENFMKGFLKSDKKNNDNVITAKEIIEIEKRRQEEKITIIAVNIDEKIFSDEELQTLKKVFENAGLDTKNSISAYKNLNTNPYYRRKTDMDYFAKNISKDIIIDKLLLESFKKTICESVNWLINLPIHWGPTDQSKMQQNANTCEGLLALKITKYDSKKENKYKEALKNILDNFSVCGLQSKTLYAETVICTSMGLFLFSLEKKNPIGNIIQEYQDIIKKAVQNLWEKRNERFGWGFYCERTSDISCNLLTTAWALLSINQYKFIADTEIFSDFCMRIFEFEADGKFGYFSDSTPKLIVTSMYLALFYQLSKELQEKIKIHYDYKQAIEYIFNELIENNVQVEVMIDENDDEMRIKRAPWNNITIGAALSALSLARRQGDLNETNWGKVLNYINFLINDCMVMVDQGKACYIPPNLTLLRRNAKYTFPTAYLIWGLQMVENTNLILQENSGQNFAQIVTN